MSTEKATENPLLSVKATEKSTARTEAPTASPLPLWEYRVNAFDEAVRRVESCECESMPCEHVEEWKRTRAELRAVLDGVCCPRCGVRPRKTIAWAPDEITRYRSAKWCDECMGTT